MISISGKSFFFLEWAKIPLRHMDTCKLSTGFSCLLGMNASHPGEFVISFSSCVTETCKDVYGSHKSPLLKHLSASF